jgi:hypothetical protein
MKKLPTGLDQQGRFPEAAEAATEIGQEPDFYGREFYREELKAVVLCGVAVVAVVGVIAFLVGRFA